MLSGNAAGTASVPPSQPQLSPLDYIEALLLKLLSIPSPTGDTEEIIGWLAGEAERLGFQARRNHKGGLLIDIPGVDRAHGRLITAHVDTLGAMVKEILPTGRLRLHRIGGFAWNSIEGSYCGVKTAGGRVVTGTILLHNPSTHVNREMGTTERAMDNMEVVLDARVDSADDARALGISVGDFVFFDPKTERTETGYIKSRHLDDKASVAIVFGVLRQLAESKIQIPYRTTVLLSNNEEIGYGGNSNIPPETVEYLAVDMGAIGDGQTTDEYSVSICAKDASGPYHQGLRRHLVQLAEAAGLHYAVDIYPYYTSDASAAILAGADVVHGLIGPGVANSHAWERTHREGLRNTYELLLRYVTSPTLQL
ncbi:MAG: M42 family metallopeptidase [Alicyclobacillus sp.]|nr:M42 family metallopeptidase [Alicyclobacillus sp.]